VAHLDWQVAAVVEALDDGTVPVHPALCFVEADWPWFAKPFQQDGVWVTWAKCLANLIATPGPLGQEAINRLAARLSVALPSG
jgi:hypothetical protein